MVGRRGIVLSQFVSPEKRAVAQALRRVPTVAEKRLWDRLRAGKQGFHFRRQQNIQGFVVDFYCHAVGLVIEVDGDVHDLQPEADAERTRVLANRSLFVLRFRNEEVLAQTEHVLKRIADTCLVRRTSGA